MGLEAKGRANDDDTSRLQVLPDLPPEQYDALKADIAERHRLRGMTHHSRWNAADPLRRVR